MSRSSMTKSRLACAMSGVQAGEITDVAKLNYGSGRHYNCQNRAEAGNVHTLSEEYEETEVPVHMVSATYASLQEATVSWHVTDQVYRGRVGKGFSQDCWKGKINEAVYQ
ncbi:hypothetical protein E2C01_034395 [Portunus trituberculatus]|uniref:Uncharacterized protein n=1 Tax=Portunus trituberculatus TaxID=210409 RepID=A0A5B7F645_PORTR|nr:hypothetical protein [Portunus trituberculatus]